MKTRFVRSLKWILGVGAFVGLCVPVNRAMDSSGRQPAPAMDASHAQVTPHADRRHMHMRNWVLEPTGIPGVSPLDPTRIPKFVNELTKPPVFVPDNDRAADSALHGHLQEDPAATAAARISVH